MDYDVVVIGAGPAGLAFVRSLSGHGLRVALVEKQSHKKLATPAFDGRDLALTHRSVAILEELGAWQTIPQKEVSYLRQARVLNGSSPYALCFDSQDSAKDYLGAMISNHHVRAALYKQARACTDVKLYDETEVIAVTTADEQAQVKLANGKTLKARLVVAADSRFSEARRKMGIPADMRDFGRSVVVCRMAHDLPHHDTAYECFHYDRTLAVLPLAGKQSSVVITLPSDEVPNLLAMPEEELNADIALRFESRLGAMRLISARISYPLVAVYADRFYGPRFALIGDAAVGMHPVTAHGFNFGLMGQHTLAQNILAAYAAGEDIGDPALLADYNRMHRRATRPLYLATNALVHLYTRTSPPAKLVRKALLVLGNGLAPIRKAITKGLTRSQNGRKAA